MIVQARRVIQSEAPQNQGQSLHKRGVKSYASKNDAERGTEI